MKKNIFIVIIITLSFFIFLSYQNIYLPKDKKQKEETLFFISSGEGFREIGEKIEKEEFIKNALFFDFYVLITGEYKNIQAGTYYLSPSMSIAKIVKKLSSGNIAKEKITIIEGWSIDDIADYLDSKNLISKEFFYQKLNDQDWNKFSFLADHPQGAGLEGYLFPDTYFLPINTNEEKIIEIILTNFEKKLTKNMLLKIQERDKSIFEIITMASLIEKEVKTIQDKKIVSGILWKRIESGMPLQVDATIAYITGKKTTKISTKETKIESPYNTYLNRGLPIGPICNPGLESIVAAIYPEKSDFWFYLSKEDGSTIFSKNYQDHLIAKNKYLKN